MNSPAPTLGTLVRHLIELLDGDLEAVYAAAGLDWRPRYTPVLRALLRSGPLSIKALAQEIGITHSAASQTVAQMTRQRLTVLKPGADARERIVTLTPKAKTMVPALQQQWAATNAAAAQLDQELSVALSTVLSEAITALQHRSFATRIAAVVEASSRSTTR
ncbi:MarR family winged helix-turn-helix transcriptional regulator [Xanthomonas vesicatoria]|uniref:MarR family transcriptional regulator n=1 Tax=Xanthomonas vesicatoria TaxID=56460 RepID=A0AAJ0IWD8_9XANT|nr:helix-turn-helix domain-containing protein [Xanthomonas vesicatoria]APO96337.1 MarR family transcriptional regulator [Xanthomonas vesicatoria]KHM92272.1 MarR family transcriptional regulator [Xanthomonas vesicatoria]KHM96883.1 MarR family transcriptional regulator [Xanthomonas vesicatoria]MCC8621716.1 MarR family transcriptional regulator [Xanthomonas vesicatoria]MCC8694356.1 MarR family transcriptional regulator [Xanthomonas vesicatoria]